VDVSSIDVVAAKAAKVVTSAIEHASTSAEIQMRALFTVQLEKMNHMMADLNHEREEHREKVRAFDEAKVLGNTRPWMAQTASGTRICTVCTTHVSHFTNLKQLNSRWLPGNGGVHVVKGFPGAIRDHEIAPTRFFLETSYSLFHELSGFEREVTKHWLHPWLG
jgi:hypothetical protein